MNKILVLSQDRYLFQKVEGEVESKDSIRLYTFSNSLDLIKYYLANHASLILLDADMVKSDVLKLIEIIHDINQQAKLILLLSPENMSLCSAALSLGILSYQVKPVSAESMVELIFSVLHNSIDTH
ncbi:MAG: response regulator [Calditrichota bacterium]|jgi:DNA-binding NtrC family response regulator